ncbi:MAG: hypothetical protein ABL897_08680 [Hyphomicrobium sp.]
MTSCFAIEGVSLSKHRLYDALHNEVVNLSESDGYGCCTAAKTWLIPGWIAALRLTANERLTAFAGCAGISWRTAGRSVARGDGKTVVARDATIKI